MAYSFYTYAYDFADADCIVRTIDTIDIGERNHVVFTEVDGGVKVIFHYRNRKGQGESMASGLEQERQGLSNVRIHLDDRDGTLHWHRTPISKKTRKC